MDELNKILWKACAKYSVHRKAHEALSETLSPYLRERFLEAINYCGMQILSAIDKSDTLDSSGKLTTRMMSDYMSQEWQSAFLDIIELYKKVK